VAPDELDARSTGLVEHTFRHEYARLVSRLAREFGLHRTEAAEDASQDALMAALRTWARTGAPEQPGAWLYRAARNKLLDDLRRRAHRNVSIDDEPPSHDERGDAGPALGETLADPTAGDDHIRFEGEIADDELRMLFVCADESIPLESQLVLALKILCGFSTHEIALRLLTTEDNVHKRLARGRERLRELGPSFDTPPPRELEARRESVLRVVYLLFNEGYSSTQADQLIRRELCDEAMRLCHLLAEHPACGSAEVDALMALMILHAARFDARIDGHGGLLLLEEQDRSKWDAAMIRHGVAWLHRSMRGERYSRYHAEAAVAVEHCLAPSFQQTDWRAIVDAYETLERLEQSPLHALNRAIAIAQWRGPRAGLDVLRAMTPPAWLARYYLWDATLGELERRAGNIEAARRHLQRALDAAPHPAERELIRRRLAACEAPAPTSEQG
jgi:RNA polymerase sigma factor (sigma-70 family)